MTPDSSDRCILFSDVVPAGVLTSGSFGYEVTIPSVGDERPVTASHRFMAVTEEYRLTRGTQQGEP